ncbi:NADPH-dependent FMN reductase [Fructilactobacillus carniphilus]|uniref:NAD(P)H-dependent oxidoreductase n=1 Tax=Fructilactobacillus carniphilus TaxID=2940297 RepID=A0ABY5BVN6_9LACO|nr:NAD(P)H-dependent oxidoreductase [Fructilactobacillus carniphilus]USS90402.1 NAD(P)H-dependent oxidoreductase [Fructilactobacillus carniphilus]
MTTIDIILGSSRINAEGHKLFHYLENHASDWVNPGQVTLRFMDIATYQLPLFNEDESPMDNPHRQLTENEQRWLDDLKQADGYVILTPEYNHSLPAALKNGLDYVAYEMQGKPVRILTYAPSARGGQFAFLALLPTLNQLGCFVLPKPTIIGRITQNFTVAGEMPIDAPAVARYPERLKRMVREIAFYGQLFVEHPFEG